MKKRFLAILAAVLLPSCLFAQFGVVSPLHVNGNQLNDAYGNKVVLHGVMDTPSPYFNKYRWGYSCTDNNISACISYYDKILEHSRILPKVPIVISSVFISNQAGPMIPTRSQRVLILERLIYRVSVLPVCRSILMPFICLLRRRPSIMACMW